MEFNSSKQMYVAYQLSVEARRLGFTGGRLAFDRCNKLLSTMVLPDDSSTAYETYLGCKGRAQQIAFMDYLLVTATVGVPFWAEDLEEPVFRDWTVSIAFYSVVGSARRADYVPVAASHGYVDASLGRPAVSTGCAYRMAYNEQRAVMGLHPLDFHPLVNRP